MKAFDVLVVGGGVVGLAAALAMSQRKFTVGLIDAGTLERLSPKDSRVYAINTASQLLLQRLGVWDKIDQSGCAPYRHMQVWDFSTHAQIDFDISMLGVERLGTIIEESKLKQALLEALLSTSVTIFDQCKITSVVNDYHGVIIGDGLMQCSASLLIVADGAASLTRDLLGVKLTHWPYYQEAIVATIGTEKTHQETAYQVFHANGPLAFLPLTDTQKCSIVWSTTPEQAQSLMALPEAQFLTALEDAFEHKLGACTLLSKRRNFTLHMQHTQQYSGQNWMLMGDAAHTIHPLAGLGLNIGLADLSSWLRLLDASKQKRWTKKMLGAYQRERKHEVWQIIGLMQGLHYLFTKSTTPLTWLRGIGLRVCNQWLPLKRWLMAQAAG